MGVPVHLDQYYHTPEQPSIRMPASKNTRRGVTIDAQSRNPLNRLLDDNAME